MPITLFHGPAGAGKTDFLLRHLFEKYGPDSYADAFFLIVPSPRAVEVYQKRLLKNDLFRPIFIGDAIVPFDRFLLRLLKFNLPRLHQATSSITRMLIRKLLFKKGYESFINGRDFGGIVAELATTLITLKKNGLTPATSHRFFERHMTPQLTDLLTLFEDYNHSLREIFYYDEGDLYAETLKLLRTNQLKLPERLKGIYVDRLFPLTLGQREILKELGRMFPQLEIGVSYSFDYQSGEDPFFYPAYSFLGEIASENEYFNLTKTDRRESGYTFTDPASEVEWIINRIEDELNRGTPPHRLGVIIPTGNSFYHRRLSELLRHRKIHFTPSFAPSLARFSQIDSLKPETLVAIFLETPMPELAETLAAMARLAEFNRQWEFEKNLLLGEEIAPELIARWRREELARIRIESPAESGGVSLLNLSDALACDFDTLFISGYIDQYYPAPLSEHPFYSTEMLLDAPMREILEGPLYRHGLDRFRLTQAINRTQKEAIFTHPKILWDGKEQHPSRLLPLNASFEIVTSSSPDIITKSDPTITTFPKVRKNQFSVSEIETYQTCPYQYYARYHLKLGRQDRDETDVPPDIRGNFVHRILQKLLDTNRDLYRDATEYDLYLNRLIDQVKILINEERKTDTFLGQAPPAISDLFCARVEAVIGAFLREEIGLIRQKIKKTLPAYFEWSFGQGQSPAFRIKHQDLEINLTGRIDRIDVDSTRKVFTVIDYKTGELDSGTHLKSGESIQIPIYMMAVQRLLLKDYQPAGGLLIGFKDLTKRSGFLITGCGEEGMLKKPFHMTAEEWKSLGQTVIDRIGEAVRKINEGLFDPAPVSQSECRFCDYRDICHYEAKEEEEA